MNVLVTTSHSFLAIDIESEKVVPVERGRGLYYGIAYSDDEIFVAARGRPVGPKELRKTEEGSILVFDYGLRLKDVLRPPFALRDMHQIVYHDHRLWVTCAFDDMIAIYDGRCWEKWIPDSDLSEPDLYHFNSIAFEDDALFLLTHNYGASDVWEFTYPELQLVGKSRLGSLAHNIWFIDKTVHTCSSGDGRVLNSAGLEIHTGDFPRGIVVGTDRIVVGISESVERNLREFTSGKLRVYDAQWNLLKDLPLPAEGLVLEVRAPGFDDLSSSNSRGQPIRLPRV